MREIQLVAYVKGFEDVEWCMYIEKKKTLAEKKRHWGRKTRWSVKNMKKKTEN